MPFTCHTGVNNRPSEEKGTGSERGVTSQGQRLETGVPPPPVCPFPCHDHRHPGTAGVTRLEVPGPLPLLVDGWTDVAPTGVPGHDGELPKHTMLHHGEDNLGLEPRALSHRAPPTPCPGHASVTCMLRFDVLLVFKGVGEGLVTGAALEG